jgi:prevent-host-death family protein
MRFLERVVQCFRPRQDQPDRPIVPVRLALYNTTEARMSMAHLLRRVSYGEEIVIARAGVPVAKLVPYRGERVREGLFRSHLRVVRDDE